MDDRLAGNSQSQSNSRSQAGTKAERRPGLAGVILPLWNWFLSIPDQRPLILALVVINFLGSLYGFYWYRDQLATTSPWVWIFVADSPLSTFYLTILLLLLLWSGRIGHGDGADAAGTYTPIDGLAYLGLVKYGFWTMFIIGLYWKMGGAFVWVDLMLFLSHGAMLVQALLFFRRHPSSRNSLLFAMAWFLVDDYLDYFKGYHATYPETSPEFGLVRTVSLISTWVVFAIFWFWRRRQRARERSTR